MSALVLYVPRLDLMLFVLFLMWADGDERLVCCCVLLGLPKWLQFTLRKEKKGKKEHQRLVCPVTPCSYEGKILKSGCTCVRLVGEGTRQTRLQVKCCLLLGSRRWSARVSSEKKRCFGIQGEKNVWLMPNTFMHIQICQGLKGYLEFLWQRRLSLHHWAFLHQWSVLMEY